MSNTISFTRRNLGRIALSAISVAAGVLPLAGRAPAEEGVRTSLAEGQTVQVPGTDLTISATSVMDFTSQGCLRGPIGCLDTAQLKITRDNLSQQITLSVVAQTETQLSHGINRTKVFDYEITLINLKNKQVVLDIAH
jgi:hypothetical protein